MVVKAFGNISTYKQIHIDVFALFVYAFYALFVRNTTKIKIDGM